MNRTRSAHLVQPEQLRMRFPPAPLDHRHVTGRLQWFSLHSASLADNRLGDPAVRDVIGYFPPGYSAGGSAIFMLHGSLSSIGSWFEQDVPDFLDQYAAGGGRSALVLIDAWTSVGGSQYLDSPNIGRYFSYLTKDLIPTVRQQWGLSVDRGRTGFLGHSSGGMGAWRVATRRADLGAVFGFNAADACFEGVHLKTREPAARLLRDGEYGSWRELWDREAAWEDTFAPALDQHMLAAAYGGNRPRYLFDPTSQIVDEGVWRRWIAHDPVREAARFRRQLRSHKAIDIRAGRSDEFGADVAASSLHLVLKGIGANSALRIEEGTHALDDGLAPQLLRMDAALGSGSSA